MSSKSSENQMEEKKKEKNQVVGYMDKNISILQNQGSEGWWSGKHACQFTYFPKRRYKIIKGAGEILMWLPCLAGGIIEGVQ